MTRVARILITLVVVAAGWAVDPAAAESEAGSNDWRTISTGDSHSCGIRTSGRLYCWGADLIGALGDGGTNTDQDTPTQVAGGHTDWTSVSAGQFFTCGRRATGRLYCWGSDGAGKLGNGGADTASGVPVQVAGGHTDWTSVSAGGSHACGRRASGRLYCWGLDFSGALGNGGADLDRDVPVQVAGGRTDWGAVSVGSSTTCARRTTGRLFCWGLDTNGQVGDGGSNTSRSTPVQVAGGHTDWVGVSAGDSFVCAWRANRRLYCWGRDFYGQLGDGGTDTDQDTPGEVGGGFTDWAVAAVGGDHACGRRTTGRLYCWGDDIDGQLGNPFVGSSDIPSEVQGGATDWRAVDVGDRHTCARISSGRLYCWGDDGSSQLGDGSPEADQTGPVEVSA